MSLSITIKETQKEAVHHSKRYAEGRSRHRALAPYEKAEDLLAALALHSPLTLEERCAIVTALVAEAHAEPHPLWQSILVAAFAPTLQRIRSLLRGRSPSDLDQRVLLAFLEAVRSVEAGPFALVALRRETTKRVFTGMKAERHEDAMEDFNEATPPRDVLKVSLREKEMLAEAGRLLDGAGGGELAAMVLETHGPGTLQAYVDEAMSGARAKQKRAQYHRLNRARGRALRELRERLEAHEFTETDNATERPS